MSLRARQCRSMLPKSASDWNRSGSAFFSLVNQRSKSWGPKGSGCTIRQSSARPLGSTSTCNRSATEKGRVCLLGVWLTSLRNRRRRRKRVTKETIGDNYDKGKKEMGNKGKKRYKESGNMTATRELTRAGW